MRTLETIVEEVNTRAAGYKMAGFQDLRKRVHGLSRTGTRNIFSSSIFDEAWTFHCGGRHELQFNLGFHGDDRSLLRYGLAFSLQASRTLPNPLDLAPKIHRFNEYFRANRAELRDLMFYHFCRFNDPTVSQDMPLEVIPDELIKPEYFLFWQDDPQE
jgi:hypothetical protein